jgi:diguanylate cyclase (GGDEF)-like protein
MPQPFSLIHRRSALLAGAVVIAALAGFAVWAGRSNQAAVNRVRSLTTVSDAYQQARHAVAQEDLAARGYRLEPDHVQLQAFNRAQASLAAALDVVRANRSADPAQVALVTAANDAVTRWFARMRARAALSDYAGVVAIDDNQLQPRFDAMTAQLDRAAAEHRTLALASLRNAQSSERMVLAVVAITIAMGALLLVSAAATMRYRARLERVRGKEVERLKRAALVDNLTGLGNHRAFEEDVALALAEATAAERPLSLALLDLDGLKQINDRHGHQAGDECIRILASVLAQAGPQVSAYRIGGDEFALLARDRRSVDTLYLVQHLQSTMAAASGDRPVAASAGAAEASPGLDRDTLIRRADLALIQAKRSHRRCVLYSETLEPILELPDVIAERRHSDALATALARAVDAKDAYTHSHCETVSELCAMIGQRLGLAPERVAKLRLAGLLHDVGKIGIIDSILQKPAALTDAEYEVMKTHTRLGHAIVSAAERSEEAEWILHHHERIDGRGYPDGLAGDAIPLESRIILVADAFEAITADRPYRAHRSQDVALAELERCAGSQFDARCVEALRWCVAGDLRQAA